MSISIDTYLSAVRITSLGELVGTGFVIGVPSQRHPGEYCPLLVTAHHVTLAGAKLEIEVVNPDTGQLQGPLPADNWWQPVTGVDLALAPYGGPANVRAIGLDVMALARDEIPAPGQPIYYVGVFQPLESIMVRSGTFGVPNVLIEKSNPAYSYKGSLMDCRSYGGFSGSPCFAEELFPIVNSNVPITPQDPAFVQQYTDGKPAQFGVLWGRSRLAGVFVAHYDDAGHPTNSEGAISRYGVGVMVPMPYIWEALESDPAQHYIEVFDAKLSLERAHFGQS